MYVNEKRLIYRVRYYPRFRASAVGLGTYHPRIRGDYCIWNLNLSVNEESIIKKQLDRRVGQNVCSFLP
jgi:hypothetical protein